MTYQIYKTQKLDIAYYDLGNTKGQVIFLIHGWPDDATAWDQIAPQLVSKGYRLIVPFLRGFGPTMFNDEKWVRDGSSIALVQDILDLADGLGISSFFVAGHDWGARVAYQLAALFPSRIKKVVTLALAYQPRGEFVMPNFSQAKNFWYQWLMMFDAGADTVIKNPVEFARIQWDTWSPKGWYDNSTFEQVAKSFKNPDWAAITLNGYRRRFQWADTDPDYLTLTRQLAVTSQITVPTLMIQGNADMCDPATESEGFEKYFENGYKRVVLEGVGHFPMREAADLVAGIILDHFLS